MTKLSTRELVCPECDFKQEFDVYDSVNVSLNPEAKKQLINGELTIFTCDECGYQVEIEYPLLFHDVDQKFMIWMDPDGQIDPNEVRKKQFLFDMLDDSYRYRIVQSRNDMVEKILIFDGDLDDKAVEFMKIVLHDRLMDKDDSEGTKLLFRGCGAGDEDGSRVIYITKLSREDQKSFSVPYDMYETISNEMSSRIQDSTEEAGRWLRVDENYFK